MEIHAPFFDETPWDKLPLAQKDQLMQQNAAAIRIYPKNTRIVLDAVSGDSIYLYRGQAKIFIFNEAGIERLLFYLAPKNSCTCGYPNISMTLETTEECEIYFLNTQKLLNAIIYEYHLFDELWASTHRRLGIMAERILDIGGASNKGKLCKLLYNLAQESTLADEDGSIIIRQLPSRNDMAFFIGTHKANVVKCLTHLEKDQIITRSGKGLLVHDLEALKTIIDEEYQQQ